MKPLTQALIGVLIRRGNGRHTEIPEMHTLKEKTEPTSKRPQKKIKPANNFVWDF